MYEKEYGLKKLDFFNKHGLQIQTYITYKIFNINLKSLLFSTALVYFIYILEDLYSN